MERELMLFLSEHLGAFSEWHAISLEYNGYGYSEVERITETEGGVMKTLRIVICILAMLVLATQAIRHVYVRFIEPRTSVLDRYEKTETQQAIQSAGSLRDLVARYDKAKKITDELDSQLNSMEVGKTKDEIDVVREDFKDDHEQEYRSERDLESAIQEWEEKSKEILELRVFWGFGFALLLAGALLQWKKYDWWGMSLVIPGIVEMIWWTSPSLNLGECPREFDRLLMNKLSFTMLSILVVLAWAALVMGKSDRKPEE